MARVTRGTKRRQRTKKIFDRAEGFVLGRGNKYRRMVEAVRRAWAHEYEGRKIRKRDLRSLWVTRVSAASNANDISYSRLISALKKSNVQLNRKMLADIAVRDPQAFSHIVNEVKSQAPAH